MADNPPQVPNMKQCLHPHQISLPEPPSAVQRCNRALALIATLALLLALAGIACSESNAKIVFISDRDGSEELYIMNADGSDVTRLTDTGGHISYDHRWSPDGRRIAFASDQSGNYEIYVMNADGSGLTQLTHSDRDDYNLAWSPDGQRIAFVSHRPADLVLPGAFSRMRIYGSDSAQMLGNFDIYLVNSDGSGLTQLTDDAGNDFNPSWSPDGQSIVFISDRDGDSDIYVMNSEGSDLTRLTHSREGEMLPNWSPDGHRILFYTWPSDADLMILHMMNPDGSDLTQVHPNAEIGSYHSFPVLSPDWQRVERVVSFADPDGDDDYEIYLANADGSDLTQLTIAENYQGPRDEQPLVFSTTIYDGNDDIYIMNPDGSGLVRLTDNTSRDFAPHVAPTP